MRGRTITVPAGVSTPHSEMKLGQREAVITIIDAVRVKATKHEVIIIDRLVDQPPEDEVHESVP